MPIRLLFVCSGNICRSPTAEAVMRHLVEQAGLSEAIEVDGAATGDWHLGERPDERAAAAAAARGITLTGRARRIGPDDFEIFDYVLAVDDKNLQRLRQATPPGSHAVVRRLADRDVPDPYYGGPDGFETVLDIVTEACRSLLDDLRADELRQG